MSQRIEFSKVIEHITEELKKAKQASPEDAVMQFEECEVEFAIELEKSGKSGINIWVVELGGGINKTETNTVRIKFKSIPENRFRFIDRSKGDVDIVVEQIEKKDEM